VKDNVVKRAVTRTLFPVGSVRTILFGPCRGMQIRLSHASGHAVLIGYDRAAQEFLARQVKPGDTVFDVGANCGQYTLLLARAVGSRGRVVACEPADAVFTELVGNIRLNSLEWVRCEPAAVARSEGQRLFYSSVDAPTMGHLDGSDPAVSVAGATARTIATITIDALAERWGPPNIIKIDTEGAAGEVLAGATATVRSHAPDFLIEVHGPDERTAVNDWANASNYSIRSLTGGYVNDLPARHVSPVWCQHVAVPTSNRRRPAVIG